MAIHDYSSTLSPQTWPFSLDWLPESAYLVGGAVRDALLGRKSEYLDLDFVLPTDAVKIAQKIALHYQAGFVLLDAERQIARVVFEQATVDFAAQEGSLETDLRRRDFTINAIAYNPYTKELFDPLQGCTDLERGWLCMVSPTNLVDDPLRLLRAYRQAAQLGFTIEPNTQTIIRQLAPHLVEVAAERVRVELGHLLHNYQGTPWLSAAWEDGLLEVWFNHTTPKIAQLSAVDSAVVVLRETWAGLGSELFQAIRPPVKTSWFAIAKLACLVTADPTIAEVELQQLKYSRAEIRAVTTALKLLPQLLSTPMSLRQQFFLFRDAGAVFPTIVVLAIAVGTPINAIAPPVAADIAPLINRYLTPDDPVAHPIPLITGKDLIQALQLSPGPQIGELLTEIALAQVEGKIFTPTDALKLASRLVAQIT